MLVTAALSHTKQGGLKYNSHTFTDDSSPTSTFEKKKSGHPPSALVYSKLMHHKNVLLLMLKFGQKGAPYSWVLTLQVAPTESKSGGLPTGIFLQPNSYIFAPPTSDAFRVPNTMDCVYKFLVNLKSCGNHM